MRKVLSALAGGALAVTLSAPAAHAARPTNPAQQIGVQGDRLHDDDGDGERRHHRRHDDDEDDDDDGLLHLLAELLELL